MEGTWDSWVGHLNCTRWCREGCLEEWPCQGGPKIVSQMRETLVVLQVSSASAKSKLGGLGVQVCCVWGTETGEQREGWCGLKGAWRGHKGTREPRLYPRGLKSFKQQEVNIRGEWLFVESTLAGRRRLYGCPGLGWWSRLGWDAKKWLELTLQRQYWQGHGVWVDSGDEEWRLLVGQLGQWGT